MRLFIAEKYELAETIAKGLGISGRGDGCFKCGQDRVTWCAGHMLQLYDPEDYDPRYRQWSLSDLPIVPERWQYKPIPNRAKQLSIIKRMIGVADEIVHAGDVDGEGQLLIDEVLGYYRVDKPVSRVLVNDYNPRLVKKALANLKDNRAFFGLSQSALARSLGDQLYGYNMTRLYSLLAQQAGYKGVLSVGRVQTPILGLIVNRDRAVESHTRAYHYRLLGQFDLIAAGRVPAWLEFVKDLTTDDKGRMLSPEPLEPIKRACEGLAARVESIERAIQSDPPPLPYDLLELQVDASRKFGISADRTLKLTQALREKHKLITYNRSDCRYLSEEKHGEAPEVLAAISHNTEVLAGACRSADTGIKSRAFNSANVTAHHAIIPTETRADLSQLSEPERQLYLLIARAYVAQFWPKRKSEVTRVVISCAGYRFCASATRVLESGWAALYKNDQSQESKPEDEEAAAEHSAGLLDVLAKVQQGQDGLCAAAEIIRKEVKSPQYYTEASLLKDLKKVAQYVKDPKVAALLREKDKGRKGENGGIGTPATRDSFIVKLKDRGFVQEKRKKLISTPVGRAFYDTLPDLARLPDMTALWHEQQKDIEAGKLKTDAFVQELASTLSEHVEQLKRQGLDAAPLVESNTQSKDSAGTSKACAETTHHNCHACGKPLVRRPSKRKSKGKTKGSHWYGCSGYPACKQTYPEYKGMPDYGAPRAQQGASQAGPRKSRPGESCPDCHTGVLTKRAIKNGNNAGKEFIGCNQFPKCRFFQWAQ